MASTSTIAKIKTDLRISHSSLDDDINDMIEACISDLRNVGIQALDSDPAILAAIKLYCRANYTDDPKTGDVFMTRYERLRAGLSMMGGYGRVSD